MKGLKFITILAIGIFGFSNCQVNKAGVDSNGQGKIDTNSIYIFQNGVETIIPNTQKEVLIDKEAFAIRFYNKEYIGGKDGKYYSAQLAAFLDKTDLDDLLVGKKNTETSSFTPGRGMASSISGKYESLVFREETHHYLMYGANNKERLNLIEKHNDYMKLEFEVNAFSYNDKDEIKIPDTELKEFYLAILIDRNLNGVIDENELRKLTFRFN